MTTKTNKAKATKKTTRSVKTNKKATPKKVATKKTISKNKKVTPKNVKSTTAKKKTVKTNKKEKAGTSKTKTNKTEKDKYLVYASDGQSFWVSDGSILNSLTALEQALENMDKEIFGYHVNDDKNDFADWVDLVLCDGECATDLRKCKTPKKASTVVVKHLKTYKE